MDPRCASRGGAQTSRLAEDGGYEVTSGIETSPESADSIVQYSCNQPLQLPLTIKVGTRLEGVGQHCRQGGKDGDDGRGDSGFDDLLCNILETVLVCLVVAFVNGEIESVGTVNLDIYQTRAVDVWRWISSAWQ